MVLMDFSIFPVGKGESLSPYVARVVRVIDESGLPYRLHAMGTTVEGELDQLLDLLRRCFEELRQDCDRIVCRVYFDDRKGRVGALDEKVLSVERQLGRHLPGAVHRPDAHSTEGPGQ